MSRILTLLFGVTGYAIFFATFVYLIGFVTGFVVPTSIAAGGPATDPATALLIDVGLILLFGVQHAIMARPWFKRWWTRIVPASIERTVFVLATCGVLALLFSQWRPLPTSVWSVDGAAAWVIHGIGFAGWGIVLLSTFLIDHFDLFGLRQTWFAFRGVPYTQRHFIERSLYRRVRHPLMLGFLIAFYAAPTMTVGHLVFAGTFTVVILVSLVLEERDLVALHGDAYREYQRRVPKLLPFGRRTATLTVPSTASRTA
jgi:methanethiol S-methyltransferase